MYDFLRGLNKGVAGDIVGAGQILRNVLPSALTNAVTQSAPGQRITQTANQPTQGIAGTVGNFVGGAAPTLAIPGSGLGAIADAAIGGAVGGGLQPTKSGSLGSHALGAGAGAGLGAIGGSLGGTAAQQAVRSLGIRIPPGRMVPVLGREWEKFTSHLPILNRMIGYGRQISLNDFNRTLYDDALDPLRKLGVPVATPAGRGSEGLDQLRTTITDRLNNVLAASTLPRSSLGAFNADMSNILADATKDLSGDKLRQLSAILKDDVVNPIAWNGGWLPGSRLAGPKGMVATINNRARTLWRSPNPEDKALAATLDRVESTLLDHADIGGGGRAELDAARQSYARYKTLQRAGSGTKAEGNVDPDSLLGELRRANKDLFTRSGMRLQKLALQASKAGVPSVAETAPGLSPWESAITGAGAVYQPHILAGAAPALLYNRPGMSALNAVANRAGQLGGPAGTAAGQALQPRTDIDILSIEPGSQTNASQSR